MSVFYFFCTAYGMNMTDDSKLYIKVAEQIYQNGFISIWKNEHLVYRPPLYPLILSLFDPSKIIFSIIILHYVVMVLVLITWYYIAAESLKNKVHQSIFIVLLALSTNFLMISVFVWSELLFLFLFSLVILSMQKYFYSKKILWMFLSIIPAFLMLIQRNAGIFIITPMYFTMIVFRANPKKHFKYMVLCFVLSISGFAIWNIHHILLESRFYMVAELMPYFTPVKNYALLFNEIGSVYYPALFLYPFSIFFTTAILAFTSYIFFRSTGITFLKILYLTALLYLSIWLFIPGDPSNMGRFVSLVVPILLLIFVKMVYQVGHQYRLPNYLKYLVFSMVLLFATARNINNALLWNGGKDYINFGKIHRNTFYKKSQIIKGKPDSE